MGPTGVGKTEVARQLATLLGAGFPLVSALESVITQTDSARLQTVLAQLREKIVEGQSMAEALQAMVSKVEKEEGTLIYTLHQAQNDPTQFLFYEKYTDAQALKAHSTTPYFKELFGALAPLLDGAPEIEMYDEIAKLKL